MAALLVASLTAGAPAPISATDDAGGGPPSWCSSAADSAAVALAQPQLLAALPGAPPLLGALLDESGSHLQLLRPPAAAKCLQQLHTHMQQALDSPGTAPSPLPKPASGAPCHILCAGTPEFPVHSHSCTARALKYLHSTRNLQTDQKVVKFQTAHRSSWMMKLLSSNFTGCWMTGGSRTHVTCASGSALRQIVLVAIGSGLNHMSVGQALLPLLRRGRDCG